MAGSYLLYNHLHYNGLMTNLGFVLPMREDHNAPRTPRSGKMLKMSVKNRRMNSQIRYLVVSL